MQSSAHLGPTNESRDLRAGVLLLLGAVLAASILAASLPSHAGELLGIVTFALVAIPVLLLPRDRPLSDLGLHRQGLPRALLLAFLLAAITLPPWALVTWLWNTRVEHRLLAPPTLAAPDTDRLATTGDPLARTWTQDGPALRLGVDPGPGARLVVDLEPPAFTFRGGRIREFDPPLVLDIPPDRSFHLDLYPRAGEEIVARWLPVGAPLDAPPRSTDRIPLSLLWLLLVILTEIVVVAFPEEFFFRGWLATRLDERNPAGARARFPGLSRNNLLVSALFALIHVITIPHPARLAVFFPSLLFGWLRERSGSLVAPILYHAACNLLVHLAAHHLLP